MTASCSGSNVFQVENTIQTKGTFTNILSGNPWDPQTLFVQTINPNGVVVEKQYGIDLDVVREEAGVYTYLFTIDVSGTWNVRWYSSDPATSTQVQATGLGIVTEAP